MTFNHPKEPVESPYEPEIPATIVQVDFDAHDKLGVSDVSRENLEKVGGAVNLIFVSDFRDRKQTSEIKNAK
ncbi:MAG: hypothetical protein PHY18_06915 [Dehalococcoidales bacterium]|nr:hypothetical protein [Dehalococcoidales bacterium]